LASHNDGYSDGRFIHFLNPDRLSIWIEAMLSRRESISAQCRKFELQNPYYYY